MEFILLILKQLPFADILNQLFNFTKNIKTIYTVGGRSKTLVCSGAYDWYITMRRIHKGVDFICKPGESIKSICEGEVVYVKTGKQGKPGPSTVKVKARGHDVFLLYMHCAPDVKKGDTVKQGTVLGIADKSGTWTGWHVHFQCEDLGGDHIEPIAIIKLFQPRTYITLMRGSWKNIRTGKKSTLEDIFKKRNPSGLKIIQGSAMYRPKDTA